MTFERIAQWLPPVLWMALIFAMSSRSTVPTAPGISPLLTAAAGHLIVYAILAVLLYRALDVQNTSWQRRAALAWVIATLYGISDEFHQYFVPSRYATVEDVILDAVGAALGLLVWCYATRWFANRQALA